jgi:hypothetical protein
MFVHRITSNLSVSVSLFHQYPLSLPLTSMISAVSTNHNLSGTLYAGAPSPSVR